MINSAMLFLPQSSCLCLRAFLLSLQDPGQLASGHDVIALLVLMKASHQQTHLAIFCLSSVFHLKYHMWVNTAQYLRKGDLPKIVIPILRYSTEQFIKKFESIFIEKLYYAIICVH